MPLLQTALASLIVTIRQTARRRFSFNLLWKKESLGSSPSDVHDRLPTRASDSAFDQARGKRTSMTRRLALF